jgi:hypothetical protein
MVNAYWLTPLVIDKKTKHIISHYGLCFEQPKNVVVAPCEDTCCPFTDVSAHNVSKIVSDTFVLHASEESVSFQQRKKKELVALAQLLRAYWQQGKITDMYTARLCDPDSTIKNSPAPGGMLCDV